MPAPVASGWSESPGGPCTHWKAPPCHGARGKRSFTDTRRADRVAPTPDLRAVARKWGGSDPEPISEHERTRFPPPSQPSEGIKRQILSAHQLADLRTYAVVSHQILRNLVEPTPPLLPSRPTPLHAAGRGDLDRDGCPLVSQELVVEENHVLPDGLPADVQFICGEFWIGIADCQAAQDRQFRRDSQLRADDLGISRDRDLDATT